MMDFLYRLQPRINVVWVILSALGLALAHMPGLYGTGAALMLTVLLQFYLPGWLLARALGKHQSPHPVARFAWVLVCAFALTVSLGAAARLLHVPIPAYLVILHGVMLVLALVKPLAVDTGETAWRFRWANLPLYAVLVLCIAVITGVALERNQYRFSGYEDQTVFTELADWLTHDPDDPGIRSRRIGVVNGDARWDTDGWTYNHAAWVWTSGVPAAQLIWFDLTRLFVWTVPLAVFGLAYEVTRREDAAVWSVAALTLIGLLTLDSLVYYPNTIAFGQFSLLQVNTLRTIATALVTPLALMPVLAYLRAPQQRYLVIAFLAGLALATLHPRQIVILLYSAGATAGLWWLAHRSRQRLRYAAALMTVLGVLMILPLLQRETRAEIRAADTSATQATQTAPDEPERADPRVDLLRLDIPLLGSASIVNPAFVFYHPIIAVGVVISLLALVGWRRSLAAQYIAGSTLFSLMLLFVPGVTGAFARVVTPTLVPGVIFGVPMALALGLAVERVITDAARITSRRAAGHGLAAGVFASVILVLLVEPFPIPASTRDQIRASNVMQAARDMHPADVLLVDSLNEVLPNDTRTVLITPERVANYVVESVPHTMITGGRRSSNTLSRPTRRFLSETARPAPWLDAEDMAFITSAGVTHIVLEADDTRATQLLLDESRFELLASPAGDLVFRVVDSSPRPEDVVFVEMNRLYVEQRLQRWTPRGFDLTKPGSSAEWDDVLDQWDAMPDSEPARLGRAFATLMMGRDDEALPVWTSLHVDFPKMPLFTEGLAHLQAAAGTPESGAQTLIDMLDSEDTTARVLAARALMTDAFFYLLDETTLDRVIAVTDADAATWDQLANVDQVSEVRARVVLLMSVGRWDTSARWSERLPEAEIDPRDLSTRASLALVQGDIDGALAVLEHAGDADWWAANRYLHPDRWQDNTAAQLDALLRGEIARREGRFADAEVRFAQAVELGATWAGRGFIAQLAEERGDVARAQTLFAELYADWNARYETPLPEFVSLLTAADTGMLYSMNPVVDENGDVQTIKATYGSPHGAPYPVETWRVQVVSPDASEFYGQSDARAVNVPGAFVRVLVVVNLKDEIAPLTPALVYSEPRYDNRVTFPQMAIPVVLNRPGNAQPPASAEPIGLRFGESIVLESADTDMSDDALTLTLYWNADTPTAQDAQVFVHVVDDATGEPVAQQDTAPVNGRYPTSQWRANTLIEDRRVITFDTPLRAGTYRVVVGMYTLPDAARLAVTPTDDRRVRDNAVTVTAFDVE